MPQTCAAVSILIPNPEKPIPNSLKMKAQEREQAQYLYFQTDYTKGQIAEMLKVNRHTISMWAHQGNWDKLRKSARTLPALVAEKCYHLVDSYTSGILGDAYTAQNINIKHAQTIHLLASSIKKLKNRSTVNETMEMFNFFLDNLNRRNPALAAQIVPEVDEYLRARGDATVNDHLTSSFSEDGSIPFPADEFAEQSLDQQDADLLNQEFEEFLHHRQPYTEPIPAVEEQDSPTGNEHTDLTTVSCSAHETSPSLLGRVGEGLHMDDAETPPSETSTELAEPEKAGNGLPHSAHSTSPSWRLSRRMSGGRAGEGLPTDRSLSPHTALTYEHTVPPRFTISSKQLPTLNSSFPDDPLPTTHSDDSLAPHFPWR